MSNRRDPRVGCPAVTNIPPPQPPGSGAPPPQPPGSYPPPGPQNYQQPPPGYAQGPPPGYPQGPPPKKGTSKLLIGLFACGGLFVAFIILITVIAAIGSNSNNTSTNATTGAGGQPAARDDGGGSGGPGSSKDNPAPVGTNVVVAKGWTLKVNSANLDAGAELAKANQFNKPRLATNKFVTVNVTVTNGSDKPGMAMIEMKVGALPPSGVKVDPSLMVAGVDTLNPTAQLQPGASVTGTLVFELAPADIPSTVLLAEPQFTLDENEDQRFLAIQ